MPILLSFIVSLAFVLCIINFWILALRMALKSWMKYTQSTNCWQDVHVHVVCTWPYELYFILIAVDCKSSLIQKFNQCCGQSVKVYDWWWYCLTFGSIFVIQLPWGKLLIRMHAVKFIYIFSSACVCIVKMLHKLSSHYIKHDPCELMPVTFTMWTWRAYHGQHLSEC